MDRDQEQQQQRRHTVIRSMDLQQEGRTHNNTYNININNAKYGKDSSSSSAAAATTSASISDTMKRFTFDTLLNMQRKEACARTQMPNHVAHELSRLCGGAGGESSGNGSGWGSPPSGTGGVPNPIIVGSWGSAAGGGNNNNASGGVPNQQQPQGPGQQLGSGGVAVQPPPTNPIAPGGGPGVVVSPNGNNNPAAQQGQQAGPGMNALPQQPGAGGAVVPGVPGVPAAVTPTTKHQLEQLNTMRDALFAQDGWGCQHVNQDTNWEVPSSPDIKEGSWKPCTANNGCELWEHNLRNGGAPPAPPVQKTPWGHTPSTNLGGTWGEDDDAGESANVWTGTPTNPQAPQWGNNNAGGPGVGVGVGGGPAGGVPPVTPSASGAGPGAPGMWPNAGPAVKKDGPDWAGAGAPSGGNWAGGNPLAGEPREMRAPSADPRMMDPRDQLRGDPRGISGRLNGSTEMWGQHHNIGQHGGQIGLNKMAAPGGNGGNGGQWPGSSMPKDIPVPKQSGWDEPSPPNQRRPFDDGTTLWGQRQPPQQPGRLPGGGGGGGNQWKDAADPRNLLRANSSGVPGGPAPQIPPNRGGPLGMKPDVGGGWGPNGGRNGGTPWEDSANHGMSWDDKLGGGGGGGGVGGGGSQWGDANVGGGGGVWNKNKAGGGGGGPMWPDGGDMSDWGGHNAGKDVSKMPPTGGSNVDLMRTEPYRILYQMGYKKEEIEHSLRATNLNFDDALEMLKQRNSGIDSWGRHDDHGSNFDQFPGGRFAGGGGQPPSQFPPNNPLSNILGNSGSGISPNFVGGMQHPLGNLPPLHQGQGGFKQPPPPTANQGGAAGQPSTLRMLVQQIKMAVQAGYLNPQILNQPLAPQTLVLLNQLLNLIKQLQMTNMNAAAGRGNVNSIQAVTKYKQQIANLQNQISAQQALYMKQQQQQQQQQQNPHDFMRNHQDPIVSQLQSNFSDMAMKQDQHNPFPNTSQQSRLNQWKLPNALPTDDANDFGKSAAVLGLQSEGPWSSGRNVTDGWPDSNADSENKDWPNTSQPSPGAAFTDLVAEFEPGKPWKGSQMKNIEDDPSITPGSVARSPLSISAAKESDLFGGMSSKTSPSDMSLNLSSSTWSYPNKLNNPTTPSGGGGGSELWGSGKGSRNPPPGLGGNGASVASNGWSAGGNSGGGLSRGNSAWSSNSGGGGGGGGGGGNWGSISNWLLLKNLTTQIDGSTLRTLCMQHGPLQHFHLYLNHSIALCKYSTMEVAQKAQMALNNCVLGNTTICAESPSENEVQNILLHLGAPGAVTPVSSGQQAPSWRPGQQGSRNSGNTAWPSSTAPNSLWGAPLEGGVGAGGAGANAASERGTPSNLNSFLPENLLGGELN